MNELSRHIEILLLDNDCVIVPGFGGFMAHHKPAEYAKEEGMFYPPQRTLGFNPQLQLNDSLLAQSYVEAYDVSYPEAVHRIEEEVEEIRQRLAVEGTYEFHGIGTITQLSDDRFDFQPCTAGLLTPTLYALNSYGFDLLPNANPETASTPVTPATDETTDEEGQIEDELATEEYEEEETEGAIHISYQALRNIAAAAIILLLLVFSSIPAGRGSSNVTMCSVIDTELISSLISSKNIDAKSLKTNVAADEGATMEGEKATDGSEEVAGNTNATDSLAAEATKKTQKETPKETPKNCFVIVLASKVSKAGAEDYMARMKKDGYGEVAVYERGTMRKVVYGRYATETEAANCLRQLREENADFAEAWISKI